MLLSIDRTNWQIGKNLPINILMVSLRIGDISVPLAWKMLGKNGNSSQAERIILMKKVLRLIPADKIDAILCDREFIGQEWFGWLQENNVKFVIRLRSNKKITVYDAKNRREFRCKVGELFAKLPRECSSRKFIIKLEEKDEVFLTLQARRNSDGKLLAVVSSLEKGRAIVKLYRKRWGVEMIFAHMKSRGLNIEDANLRSQDRMGLLVMLVAIAYICIIRRAMAGFVPKHDNRGFLRISMFKYGIAWLAEDIYASFRIKKREFKQC